MYAKEYDYMNTIMKLCVAISLFLMRSTFRTLHYIIFNNTEIMGNSTS